MSDEKRYSAKEAAVAVLKKAEEMLKSSSLAKKANPDEKADAKLGEEVEGLVENHMTENKEAEKEEGHKIVKAEPKGEIHPKAHVEGEKENPGERIEEQVAPEDNPHEQAEGNNPEWGAEAGHYKLAKFCGHMSAKRKMRSGEMDKGEHKHEHVGWDKLHSKLKHEGYSEESADKIAGSIKAKVHPGKK